MNTNENRYIQTQKCYREAMRSQCFTALRDAVRELGKPIPHLERQDKIQIVYKLNRAGVFSFRQAVDIVAQELGAARSSIYNYLKDSRNA